MSSEFQLGAIGQIHIGVTDIHRAVAFYRDILGMTLLFEVPDQQMAFFDCGGISVFVLHRVSMDGTKPPDHVAFFHQAGLECETNSCVGLALLPIRGRLSWCLSSDLCRHMQYA